MQTDGDTGVGAPKPRQMITEKRLLEIIPVARSTIQAWVADPNDSFPKPVRIGQARKVWFADEVSAWQREKAQSRQ